MTMTIDQYIAEIDDLLAAAKGDLLAKVQGALGPASRHCTRVHFGELTLTSAVEREITRSIARAKEILA